MRNKYGHNQWLKSYWHLCFTGKRSTLHVWISVIQSGSPTSFCEGACKRNWWMAIVSLCNRFQLFFFPQFMLSVFLIWWRASIKFKECEFDQVLTSVIMNSLRQDIIDLAKPGLQTAYKLRVTSRLERMYDCLLPSLKRQ